MGDRVTLADVAARAGVSTATASIALAHGSGSRISAATAQRVRVAAAELGYVPDATARSLRTGRTGTLGFVSDEVTVTRFASAMVRGILDAAEAREHVVMMMEVGRDHERLEQAVAALRARRADALVVGMMDSRELVPPRVRPSTPRVVVNGRAAGFPAILPDEERAGREAVDHLLDRGHRRITLVGRHPRRPAPEVSVNIGVRLDGIDAAMARRGLTFADVVEGTVWEPDLGYQGAAAVLARTPGVTAFLAANDRIAFGIYQAVQERGLRVPEDVSVLSFDDEPLAALTRPGVTTLRLPYREMGEMAVASVLAQVADGVATSGTTFVPLPLVERGSVRAL